MQKWLLLDGFNLMFRAFYGMPELTRADGFPTNALHGWVRTLWRLEDDQKPARTIVFFDLGGAAKREALQEDYKANRSEMPEQLAQQLPHIKELTRLLGYRIVEQSGIEADDLLGAVAEHLSNTVEDSEAIIVSADKDLAQCLKPGVSQLLPPPTANPKLGWRTLTHDKVVEKFGVHPEVIPDYLALIGDTSDNIPGLKGVGPKTAAKWIGQYGNLDKIIANCGRIKPPRFQAIIHGQQEQLRQNLIMTTMEPVDKLPDISPSTCDLAGAVALLQQMEMNRTAEELQKRTAS